MPILKREPDLYPDDLFEHPVSGAPWWVAYVRSRQEKALARHLFDRQISFYLPKRQKEVRRGGRRFVSHLPLFPGYVFFAGGRHGRLAALRSRLVVHVLPVEDQCLLHRELIDLHELQLSGLCVVPHPYLETGDAVEIHEGPFKGYRGTVVRESGRLRLVVSISLLRRSVAVELDRELLAPIPVSRLDLRSAVAAL